MALFGKLFTKKKFTVGEKELIEDFLTGASNDIDKQGFKVTFKRDRNLEAKFTTRFSDNDMICYNTFDQNKLLNYDQRELSFTKMHYFEVITKSFVKIDIHFVGRGTYEYDPLGPYYEGINVEGNHYEIETAHNNYQRIDPKEFFDTIRRIFVKNITTILKNK